MIQFQIYQKKERKKKKMIQFQNGHFTIFGKLELCWALLGLLHYDSQVNNVPSMEDFPSQWMSLRFAFLIFEIMKTNTLFLIHSHRKFTYGLLKYGA